MSCVEWFHRHDVAGVFADCYTYEVMPPEPARLGRPASPCTCSTSATWG